MKRYRTPDGGAPKPAPIYGGALGQVRRAVDSLVATFAPATAHGMRQARIRSAALLAYEAARVSRTQPRQRSGSADAEILPDLPQLRAGARNMVRDDAHAAAGKRVYEENVVGKGIMPQAMCTPEDTGLTDDQCEAWNRALEREWERWCDEAADATERGSFYDLQRIVAGSMLPEGESIGHAVIDGGEIRCELIDPDRLESPGWQDTARVRGGVEVGPRGQPLAYHVLRAHPNEHILGQYSRESMRLAATEGRLSVVQHVFRRERPGQTRGVPWLTSALPYSGHLHHYLNSELIAARATSNIAMFVKRAPDLNNPDITPVAGDGGVETFHETLEPGIIEYLNEGEEIQPFVPNRPGTQFEPFVKRILRAIWAAPGLAYEIVTKDFGSMNYSSARALLLECRRSFDCSRLLLVRQFCMPWWRNVAYQAINEGRLKAPAGFFANPRAFLAVRWVPPAYGWVDPTKEIEASGMAVEKNLSTPYDEASRAGFDAEAVVLAKARFLKFCREQEAKFGLAPGSLTANSQAPAPASAKPDPDEDEGDEKEEGEELDDEELDETEPEDAE